MGLGYETEHPFDEEPERWPTQQWAAEAVPVFPLPLKERIQRAKDHAQHYAQRGDLLWPHMRFALTIGELLDAADRGA